MKKITNLLLITIVSVSMVACNGQMNKQGGGTLIGGVAGGLLGSQFGKGGGQMAAVGVGALAGALIGNQIGKSMDEYDKQMLAKSSHQALEFSPSGSTVAWNNPDSGNHGSITPMKTFKEQGQYCREYQQEIVVGGERKKAYGKACRQADGHWKIVQ
jgi:surface antigen